MTVMTRRDRFRRIVGGTLIVVCAGAGAVLAGTAAAQAAPFFTASGQSPGHLTLEASPWIVRDAQSAHALSPGESLVLSPGDRGYWEIRAAHDDPSGPATLSVVLTAEGELSRDPQGLRVVFQQCLTEWTGMPSGTPTCAAPGGATTLPPATASASTPRTYLVDLAAGSAQHMLVTATLDGIPADEEGEGLDATVGIGLTAARTDAAAPPAGGPLAATGIDGVALLQMLGVALAAVGAGIGVRMLRRTEPTEDAT